MRDAGSGVREGGGLMAAEYLWGMCIDEFEKPVQVESFKPSQVWRLLKKFIMKMMMASKGIIYSFYTV